MNLTGRETRQAIDAAKAKAQTWNACDPSTSISAEAAKQITLATLEEVFDSVERDS